MIYFIVYFSSTVPQPLSSNKELNKTTSDHTHTHFNKTNLITQTHNQNSIRTQQQQQQQQMLMLDYMVDEKSYITRTMLIVGK